MRPIRERIEVLTSMSAARVTATVILIVVVPCATSYIGEAVGLRLGFQPRIGSLASDFFVFGAIWMWILVEELPRRKLPFLKWWLTLWLLGTGVIISSASKIWSSRPAVLYGLLLVSGLIPLVGWATARTKPKQSDLSGADEDEGDDYLS